MRLARWAAVAATMLAGTGLVACSQIFESQPCQPPQYSLSQDTVSPGGSITVSAGDATCDPRYGDNAQIQVEVVDGFGATIVETLAPMNDAGGFSAAITFPVATVPGLVSVAAYPYNLDWCDDTGRNNRVGRAAPSGFVRASCVMPSMPLTITW